MSNSTLPKSVTDYFSSLGKRGGATRTRKGFAVSGDPREAQAKSVEARRRNAEARKAQAAKAAARNDVKLTSSHGPKQG